MSEATTRATLTREHTAMSEEDALRFLDGHRITRGEPHDGPEGPDRRRVRQVDPRAGLLSAAARVAPAAPHHGALMDEPAPALRASRTSPFPGPPGAIPARVYDAAVSSAPALPGRRVLPRRRLGARRSRDPSRALRAPGARVRCNRRRRRLSAGARAQVPGRGRRLPGRVSLAPVARADVGADPGRVAVAGDSAGGNLSAVVSQLRRRGHAGADVPGAHLSRRRLLARYGIAPRAGRRAHHPARPHCLVHGAVSAGGGGPSTICVRRRCARRPARSAAGPDRHRRLRSVARRGAAYGERLRAAGVDVVYREYPGQIHAFVSLTKAIPQGMACTREIGDLPAGAAPRVVASEADI